LKVEAEPMIVGAVQDDHEFLALARNLGIAVRERREQLDLSQQQLAHLTGLPQRRIWEMERARTSPQLVTWLRLARGLDTRLGDLLSRAESLVEAESV
jgi:transcriptional regulator with XRE-family HTH domain